MNCHVPSILCYLVPLRFAFQSMVLVLNGFHVMSKQCLSFLSCWPKAPAELNAPANLHVFTSSNWDKKATFIQISIVLILHYGACTFSIKLTRVNGTAMASKAAKKVGECSYPGWRGPPRRPVPWWTIKTCVNERYNNTVEWKIYHKDW